MPSYEESELASSTGNQTHMHTTRLHLCAYSHVDSDAFMSLLEPLIMFWRHTNSNDTRTAILLQRTKDKVMIRLVAHELGASSDESKAVRLRLESLSREQLVAMIPWCEILKTLTSKLSTELNNNGAKTATPNAASAGAFRDDLERISWEVVTAKSERTISVDRFLHSTGVLGAVGLNLSDIDFKALQSCQEINVMALKWKNVGTACPHVGTEIKNEGLHAALQKGKCEFDPRDFTGFGVVKLSADDYIRVNNQFYQPIPEHMIVAKVNNISAVIHKCEQYLQAQSNMLHWIKGTVNLNALASSLIVSKLADVHELKGDPWHMCFQQMATENDVKKWLIELAEAATPLMWPHIEKVNKDIVARAADSETKASDGDGGKFSMMPTAKFGTIDSFHDGLDKEIGLPQPDVFEQMRKEHDIITTFHVSNYGGQTCPLDEWNLVVNLCDYPPEWAQKRQVEVWKSYGVWRELRQLEKYMKCKSVRRAGLTPVELIGLRLYTGPMFMLVRRMQILCIVFQRRVRRARAGWRERVRPCTIPRFFILHSPQL